MRRTRSSRGRTRPVARRTVENELRRCGFGRIAGVDEVGRGCLAGPVVAAAVVLGPGDGLRGLRDSKLLTSTERARLYDDIIASCLAWAIGMREPEEIDRLNIHQASLEAMRDAVGRLTPLPDFVLVDAFRIPRVFIPQRGVVGGDRRCAGIAACVSRRQSDPRPSDDPPPRGRSPLWLRSAQGATRPRTTSPPWRSTGIRERTGVRFDPHPCFDTID